MQQEGKHIVAFATEYETFAASTTASVLLSDGTSLERSYLSDLHVPAAHAHRFVGSSFGYCRGSMLFTVLSGLILFSGCKNEPEPLPGPTYEAVRIGDVPEFVLAVHPLHNPQELHRIFNPLVKYLNSKVDGMRFRLEASYSYESFERKLYGRAYDIALPNPLQTVRAVNQGYRVFAKMGDDESFRGILVVAREAGIKTVDDLRYKSISYPAPTALAATLMTQEHLQSLGLDIVSDTKSLFVGSRDSALMNVVLGNSAAAGTWPAVWRNFIVQHPALAKKLEVKWTTAALVNNGFVARADVSTEKTDQIASVLLDMKNSDEGREILAGMQLTEFETATEETYSPVATFLTRYLKEIGALPNGDREEP